MKFKKPEMKTPDFNALSEKEFKEINGGKVDADGFGTCLIIGYTCFEEGSFKTGSCLIAGFTCTEEGSF